LRSQKKKEIISALKDLCDIGFAEKNTDGEFLIDSDLFYNQEEGFEGISFNIFDKLKHSAGLLKHYILIKRGLIDGACKFSVKYFAEKEQVSDQTISNRNKELVDLKLIKLEQQPYNKKTGQYGHNIYKLYNA